MNPEDPCSDASQGHSLTTHTFDREGKLRSVEDPAIEYVQHPVLGKGQFIFVSNEAPYPVEVRHDEAKRVFRVTGPDDNVTEFHDRALRFLEVEPNPETGKLMPVMWGGKPRVIYLCREAGL